MDRARRGRRRGAVLADFDVFAGPGTCATSAPPPTPDGRAHARYALPFVAAHATDPNPFFLWLSLHPPHGGLGRLVHPGRRCSKGRPDEAQRRTERDPPARYASRFTRARVPRPPSFDEARPLRQAGFRREARPHRRADAGADRQRLSLRPRCAALGRRHAVADLVAELRSARKAGVHDDRLHRRPGSCRASTGCGAKTSLRGGDRDPLLRRLARRARAGTVNAEPVVNADLAPAILDARGRRRAGQAREGARRRLAAGGDAGRRVAGGARDPARGPQGRHAGASWVAGALLCRRGRALHLRHRRARVANRAEGIELEIGAGRTADLELYDLRRDPYQLQSRDGDSAYAAARRALAGLLGRLEHCAGADCAVTASVPRPGRDGARYLRRSGLFGTGMGTITKRAIALATIAFVALGLTAAVAAPGKPALAGVGAPNVVLITTDDRTLASLRVMRRTRAALGDPGATLESYVASYPLYSRSDDLDHRAVPTQPRRDRQPAGHRGRLREPARAGSGAAGLARRRRLRHGAGRQVDPQLPGARPRALGWDEWRLVPATATRYYDYELADSAGGLVGYGSGDSDYQTDVFTRDYAVPYIRAHAIDPDPFFLHVSYGAALGRGSQRRGGPPLCEPEAVLVRHGASEALRHAERVSQSQAAAAAVRRGGPLRQAGDRPPRRSRSPARSAATSPSATAASWRACSPWTRASRRSSARSSPPGSPATPT